MPTAAESAIWNDLRAYALGDASKRNVTQAEVQQRMRQAALAQARGSIEGAQADAALKQQRLSSAQASAAYQQQTRAQSQQRFADAQQRRAQAQADAQALERKSRVRGAAQGISRLLQAATPDRAAQGASWLQQQPTPGGLTGILAVLVVFNLAIVPVGPNGESRLLLVWQALTGQVTLPSDIPAGPYSAPNPATNPVVQGALVGAAGEAILGQAGSAAVSGGLLGAAGSAAVTGVSDITSYLRQGIGGYAP